MITLGFNHQSNGQSRPLSRSWNRIVGNVGFEKDNLVLLLKSWYRVPEDKHNDDNHDIEKYMGYGESLIDYNHSVNRIGIGFVLSDWN